MDTDCRVCFDEGPGLLTLACGDAWCVNCLTKRFDLARVQAQYPVYCCDVIPFESVAHALPPSLVQDLRARILAYETPAHLQVFCSNVACSAFVPRTQVNGNVATCSGCGTHTCLSCKKRSHEGECVQSEDEKAMETAARENGWPRCPSCKVYVERISGCAHMICGCTFAFCFFCRRNWDDCYGECPGAERERMLERALEDVDVDEAIMDEIEAEDRRIDRMDEGPEKDAARAAWQVEFDRLTAG